MFSLGRWIGPNNLSGVVFKGRITCKLAHQALDCWPSVIAGVKQHYRGLTGPVLPLDSTRASLFWKNERIFLPFQHQKLFAKNLNYFLRGLTSYQWHRSLEAPLPHLPFFLSHFHPSDLCRLNHGFFSERKWSETI